jgi:hypothetical protein
MLQIGYNRYFLGLVDELLGRIAEQEHGFSGEWEANTDGIGPLLKSCYTYWQKEEPKRLRRLAEIANEIAKLEEERKNLV